MAESPAGTDDAASAARAARRELEALLDETPSLRDSLPVGFADAAERYVRLLLEANQRLNLTRVTDGREVARRHLLDALSALPLLDVAGAQRLIDIGSGGGVPAIPLAIARPEAEWVMVDSTRKKAAALEQFVAALGLARVQVVAERAEVLGRDPSRRERFAVATARACAPLPVLVELGLPLVEVGGLLLAWKGPLTDADDEVRRGRVAAGQLGAGRLEIRDAGLAALGGHTHVLVPKERATDARYPRRPGEPARRPLG